MRGHQPGGDLTMQVDGGTAEIVDVVHEMYAEFPRVALVIVLATYLVLLLLFRSVVLPLKAIVMNALSIVASYGALVFIFQEGHFSQSAWVRTTRLRRSLAADPDVLYPVWSVDGLRGLSALARARNVA